MLQNYCKENINCLGYNSRPSSSRKRQEPRAERDGPAKPSCNSRVTQAEVTPHPPGSRDACTGHRGRGRSHLRRGLWRRHHEPRRRTRRRPMMLTRTAALALRPGGHGKRCQTARPTSAPSAIASNALRGCLASPITWTSGTLSRILSLRFSTALAPHARTM